MFIVQVGINKSNDKLASNQLGINQTRKCYL